jgi:ABC-2 type transport system ATP-binding protein
MKAAVVVRDLSHYYSLKRGQRTDESQSSRRALHQVQLDIPSREIFALLGPNGGGKTTLFKILSTLLLPSSGQVEVFGADVVEKPHEVRKKIGIVFQGTSLDKKLKVEENLRYAAAFYGLHGRALDHRLDEVLDKLGIKDRRNDFVEELSGGLARRVDVAKGLLHRPHLLILDEPSTGLDPGARRDLKLYFQNLVSQEGISVLFTTHLMEEAEYASRVAILNRGEVVTKGTPDSLKGEIGGGIITMELDDSSMDPAKDENEFCREFESRFGGSPQKIGEEIRVEHREGAEMIPKIVEAFSGKIKSIRFNQPTLEDVFIEKTGHQFWEASD